MISVAFAILCVSVAMLGLELVLMRSMAIAHWHHLVYLIISTALLGLGAGGSITSIWQKFFRQHHFPTLLILATLFGITTPLVFWLAQKLSFDQLQLIWDWRQLFYLMAYYLLFSVPFFFAGFFICVSFTVFAEKSHKLYFFNMVGSGLGAGAFTVLMYGHSPGQLILLVSTIAFLGAAFIAYKISSRAFLIALIFATTPYILARFNLVPELRVRISENKALAYYIMLPKAQILTTQYSPLGRLDIIEAEAIHHIPGLSIKYQGPLPKQNLLITDADGISTINHFNSIADLSCYDSLTSALVYHLVPEPNVCIIGSGGGSDIAQGLFCNARSITAVEMNAQILTMFTQDYSKPASNIYNHPMVKPVLAQGRSFLHSTGKKFDIIQISMFDAFTAASAGVYALNESHLYTVEAISKAMEKLTENGLLSITRPIKTPPRDSLKMLTTITQALKLRQVNRPADHIIMIRSWATVTIAVCPKPLTKNRLSATRMFCQQRGFDLVHLPGIKPNEANRYHVLQEPFCYDAATEILSDRSEQFQNSYVYHIAPATDDRPYFFDFFKFRALPHMIRNINTNWLAHSEWGYLILLATLVQAGFASLLFILLPLFIAKPVTSVTSGKLTVFTYFLLLGVSYMFLEMGFIQKITLLIGSPVFGVTVTIICFLVCSGLGSLFSVKFFSSLYSRIVVAVIFIIIIGITDILILNNAFDWLMGFSMTGKIIASVSLAGPLAFFMGIPFPTTLVIIDRNYGPLVPWAWAVNGFASVTAVVLGTSLSVIIGFNMLTLIALALYLSAVLILKRIC